MRRLGGIENLKFNTIIFYDEKDSNVFGMGNGAIFKIESLPNLQSSDVNVNDCWLSVFSNFYCGGTFVCPAKN